MAIEKKVTDRQKQAEAMREHIKETALALFREYGYENVSMAEIAKAAGCSVGNIYHYYKNKSELSIQVTDHVDEQYAEIAAEYEEDTQRTAKEKLLDFVGRSLVISFHDADLYTSFAHAMQFPEQGILAYKPDRVWYRLLRQLIRQCQEEGSIPADTDEKEILNALIVIHRGTLMQYRIQQESFPLEEWGRNMAEAYLNGIPSPTKK